MFVFFRSYYIYNTDWMVLIVSQKRQGFLLSSINNIISRETKYTGLAAFLYFIHLIQYMHKYAWEDMVMNYDGCFFGFNVFGFYYLIFID